MKKIGTIHTRMCRKSFCRPSVVCGAATAVLSAALFLAMAFVSHPARADKENLTSVMIGTAETGAADPAVLLVRGKADVVALPAEVSDVLVADPSIVEVLALKSNKIYLVGASLGSTNLMAVDAQGDVVARMDVHVRMDDRVIQEFVDNMFPEENVKVTTVHDQVMLTGEVSSPAVASRVAGVVAAYAGDYADKDGTIDELIENMLDVRGEQQVMLRVKVVEASRSLLKELGVQTSLNDRNELSEAAMFNYFPAASDHGDGFFSNFVNDNVGLTEDPFAVGQLVQDTGIAGLGFVELLLTALEEDNLVSVLAEPNLTAISGEQAGFLAGGEFPVPTGRDNQGNIQVEFREFGVALNFRPTVISDRRINMQLNTEVSSLDFENAVTLEDIVVPGLDIRRASTTVEIPSGGSLMIAGLLKSEMINGMTGLPGIRNTPILGDLVSSDSFQREETELVVIVTAYMVEPYEDKSQAQEKTAAQASPLTVAFAHNVRAIYNDRTPALVDDTAQRFGYLLD